LKSVAIYTTGRKVTYIPSVFSWLVGRFSGRMELELEVIALRHQLAVLHRQRPGRPRLFCIDRLLWVWLYRVWPRCLERSGTRRPCFRLWDRLFWILFSRWWPLWRDSLIIVQPETVLRWRREGWSALWRYRSRGRWRGGRPRVSNEVRHLIVRMARENFLCGAPRIHGELLILGFKNFLTLLHGLLTAQEVARQFEFNSLHHPVS
jgi:putative transposase